MCVVYSVCVRVRASALARGQPGVCHWMCMPLSALDVSVAGWVGQSVFLRRERTPVSPG
jgi:hypothetical protein